MSQSAQRAPTKSDPVPDPQRTQFIFEITRRDLCALLRACCDPFSILKAKLIVPNAENTANTIQRLSKLSVRRHTH
jgi:hypothetical protein